MTATLSRRRETAGSVYTVQRLVDRDAIRGLLAPDRAYGAYALAQLEPGRFEQAEWFAAVGPIGRALVVHSRGGLGRAFFTLGDPRAVDVILSLHPGARFTFGSLRPEHRRTVQKHFVMTRQQVMTRMTVAPETFRPVESTAVRLSGRDTAAINRLYSAEGGPAFYRPSHVEDGVYYGVFVEGRLVSIAGTHAVSISEGVAVVGNVFTHPRYRRRGLATVATSAVTSELLERCPLVVLTVEAGNEAATTIYRRLGYAPHCTLYETPLIRKDPTGLLSLTQRLMAGWRGRREGKEVVVG